MAQKSAVYNYQLKKCNNEAKDVVSKWFKDNKIAIDENSIYVVWFAFTKTGYRCMATSKVYQNNFFEINKNVCSGELICHVLQQVECIVHPSQSEAIVFEETITDLLD